MELVKRTLLTIISEAAIERLLVKDLQKLGAHGYTIMEARGGGAHGERMADEEHNRNIQVEVICERAVAEKIIEHLTQTYYRDFAMVSYFSEVEVVRPHKF